MDWEKSRALTRPTRLTPPLPHRAPVDRHMAHARHPECSIQAPLVPGVCTIQYSHNARACQETPPFASISPHSTPHTHTHTQFICAIGWRFGKKGFKICKC